MAKKTETSANQILLIIIVAIVAFGLGYVLARGKYKSELATTYNMVMERDSAVTSLKAQMQAMENNLKMNEQKTTGGY